MTSGEAHRRRRPGNHDGSALAGTVALILGGLSLAATAYIYALSLVGSFNPPNWMRVVGIVWLPVGLVGAPIAYAAARRGPRQASAVVGLGLAAAALAAFVALLFIAG